MEVQIGMTLEMAGEEVVVPGKVGTVMDVCKRIRVTLNVTSVVSLVTIAMSVLSGKMKRQI